MGLMKPPGLLTFLIATALAGTAVAAKSGLALAGLQPFAFWLLLASFALLFLASLVRGL